MRVRHVLLMVAAFGVGSTTAATAQVTDNEIRTCIAVDVPYYLYLPQGNVCANDRYLTWSRQGQVGPTGAPGAQGPQGEAGPAGPPGALPAATIARIRTRIVRSKGLESRLRVAKPGSAAAQRATLELLRLLRESDADLVNQLAASG
jgi:hypothetical protein